MKWNTLIVLALLGFVCTQTYGRSTKRRLRSAELIDLIAQESNTDLVTGDEVDLEAGEATNLGHAREQSLTPHTDKKYSSRYSDNKIRVTTEVFYGTRTTPKRPTNHALDFRIPENVTRLPYNKPRRKIKYIRRPAGANDMRVAENGNGKRKKETETKKDDDEEKTLSQQVADGKYGLIQNEIFPNGSKRPGILSYLPNPEVPSDTRDTLGGLDKDEIWLAEDHVLVLKGGLFSDEKKIKKDWPPIDDYEAPPRQVKIPNKPKIPPPFPVQLSDDGPLEFLKGVNGTGGPNLFPRFPPLGSFPIGAGPPFPGQGLPFPPPNGSLPYPPPHAFVPPPNITEVFPPNRPLPPFLANLPPGAAFLPPPGNVTDFDEDDPSIYYPPPYDFFYPRDNSTDVPPGPLVPGIILPPPPDFFAPLSNDTDKRHHGDRVEDNETEDGIKKPSAVYLPVPRKQTVRFRTYKKPQSTQSPDDLSNHIKDSTRPDMQSTTPTINVHLVYPDPTNKPDDMIFVKKPDKDDKKPLQSPIYVPSSQPAYYPLPTTSPKPNHITLPKSETLKNTLPQEIYVITKERGTRRNQTKNYDNVSPDGHPFRTLIKPNVTVSYVGKYGQLPTAPAARNVTKTEKPPPPRGHYVTVAPRPVYKHSEKENEVVSVSTIPPKVTTAKPTAAVPSKATFFFYDEPGEKVKVTDIPLPGILQTTDKMIIDFVTPKPTNQKPSHKYETSTPTYYSTVTTKTPVRQFLEETFHASNVLPNKPQTSHYVVPSHFEPGYHRETVPKTKLNYAGAVTKAPKVNYHYVTDSPKPADPLSVLEIENAGSSGLQTIKLNKNNEVKLVQSMPVYTTTVKPYVASGYEYVRKPPDFRYTTPKPDTGPFIPSNYYATANPQDLYLTPQDHKLVDEITKNYFTIFGQKIVHSTTPLTPTQTQDHVYVQEYNTVTVQPSISPRPDKAKYQTIRRPPKVLKVNPTEPTKRPKSNFEQYLKEVTGEDQSDYVEVMPMRTKKPKNNLGFTQGKPNSNYNPVSVYLSPPEPPSHIPQQYLLGVNNPSSIRNNYKYIQPEYVPNYSSTVRPTTVEIEPQYIQHISSTVRPIISSTVRPSHDYRQYLQEISTFTSPTTLRPVRIKNPTPVPYINGVTYNKPISLESDIVVNYKQPRPAVNPEAEIIGSSLHDQTNFKIVDPPDLSRQPPKHIQPQQYVGTRNTRPNKFVDVPMNPTRAKEFFQNLPNSGYFNPVDHALGNSFISYNLPGNGGHFYFLTPQAAEQGGEGESHYNVAKRSDLQENVRQRGGRVRHSQEQINEDYPRHSYTNQDYLRRRRKKS